MKEICRLLIFAILFLSVHTNSKAQEVLNSKPEVLPQSQPQELEDKDVKAELIKSNALAIRKALNNELEEARQIFTRNLELQPDCNICRYNLAWVYMEMDQYDKVIELTEPIVKTDPGYAKAIALLGFAYMKKERYSDSLRCLKQAASSMPEKILHAKMGFIYSKLGDLKEALSHFDKALKLDSADPEVLNNRGHVLYLMGRHHEAMESLEKAVLKASNQAEVYNNLGVVYEQLGKDKKAIESYQKAIVLNSDYPDPRFNLGLLYLRTNDRKAAYEELWQLEKFNSPIAEKLRDAIKAKFVFKLRDQ